MHKEKAYCFSDFLAEIREVRRQWNDIFRVLREKRNKPVHKNFLPKTLPFKNKGEIKTFPNKQLRMFVASKILKDVIQDEKKWH